jgi:hypothetical protein
VDITVRDPSGEDLGEATSGDRGAWEVPVDGPGDYTVLLIADTLPEGIVLADPGANPPVVTVDGPGVQDVPFKLVGEGDSAAEQQAEAPASPTPAEAAGPTASFVAAITDENGYQFDVAVRLRTSDLGATVEFDKPGFMSTYFTLGLDIDLINKTPGRTIEFASVTGVTAPLSNPKFIVSAVWEAGDPVCSAASIADTACAMVLGFGYANVALAPDSTLPLDIKKGFPNGRYTAGLGSFPEDSWPQVESALASPDRYLVSYDGGDYSRFVCEDLLVGFVVADSSGTSDCPDADLRLVTQPQPL